MPEPQEGYGTPTKDRKAFPTVPADPVRGRLQTKEEVDRAHVNSDRDASSNAQHHTLGPDKHQASPGDHTHDGGDSKSLLEDVTISGSRTDGTAVASIIAALEQLGATDGSSA